MTPTIEIDVAAFGDDALKNIFNRIGEQTRRRKEINASIDDVLLQSKTYVETRDQLEQLKAKRTEIIHQTMQQFPKEAEELDKIKVSLAADRQLLADLALTMYTKGKSITLEDADAGIKYEPVFRISFKKEQLQLPL